MWAIGFIALSASLSYALTARTQAVTAFAPHDNAVLNWAQYSPFSSLQDYSVPGNCRVTQVNLIERHGARYPTDGATKRIRAALDKILAVEEYGDVRLQFLSNYTYDLGIADLLPFGAAQAQQSGQTQFLRYNHLIDDDHIPFVRASGSDRVIDTALNWTAGFSAASHHRYNPPLALILSEELNDTLDDNMCPSAGNSDEQTDLWLSVYAPPITARLNSAAPGANLSDADIYSLLSLCPFDTAAKQSRSPFCDAFDSADFIGFEYSGDLDKYYGTGYGQALGPVQGVGYLNELIARLTGRPVEDETQTNRTLDASEETFPLNRTLYADFSHDNQMIAIYAAMGLFAQSSPLDPLSPDSTRSWRADRLVPFSARMVTEKLICEEAEYVRVLVGDEVQPLEFCGDGNGLCTLDAFVESQAYARHNGEGDFEKCFQ